MQDFPINKQLVILRSISKRHPAKHLPKSVYSMPMNHDSFTWVGVMALRGARTLPTGPWVRTRPSLVAK